MHGSVLGWFISAVRHSDAQNKDVLEVGAYNVNGTIRPMIEARGPRSYLAVDIVEGPGVDQVINCETLTDTVGTNSADLVVSTEMLEHVENWQACIRQLIAALRPGGVLLLTTRSVGFPYHHPPDNWRYTTDSFTQICDRAGLEPQVICADPEQAGVFVRAYKPTSWTHWDYDSLDGITGVTPVREPFRILGLPHNPDGCGYYRFWQPYQQLSDKSGHLIGIPAPGNTPYDPVLPEIEVMDVVAKQRPHGTRGLREWERWKGRTKLVYETDDNVIETDTSLPGWGAPIVVETVQACVRLADLVTVSTPVLADKMRVHNDNVIVIPNYIHEDLLKLERPQRDNPTICWAGGHTHLQDLAMIQTPLNTALDMNPHADLHFIGSDYRPLFNRRGRFSQWETNVWDYYTTIDGDIGIIPLRSSPFNDSRSHIKALEYAALGIPVVASDIEPYREFVEHGSTGWLVNTEAEWLHRITDLIHDPHMRAEMGEKAKAKAHDWTIQEHWPEWARAYEGVANGQ